MCLEVRAQRRGAWGWGCGARMHQPRARYTQRPKCWRNAVISSSMVRETPAKSSCAMEISREIAKACRNRMEMGSPSGGCWGEGEAVHCRASSRGEGEMWGDGKGNPVVGQAGYIPVGWPAGPRGLLEVGGAGGVADGVAGGVANGVADGVADDVADGVAGDVADGLANVVANGVADGVADGGADGRADGGADGDGVADSFPARVRDKEHVGQLILQD